MTREKEKEKKIPLVGGRGRTENGTGKGREKEQRIIERKIVREGKGGNGGKEERGHRRTDKDKENLEEEERVQHSAPTHGLPKS